MEFGTSIPGFSANISSFFLNNTVIVTTDFHVMIRFRSKTLMINNRLCSPSVDLLFLSLLLSKLENKIPNRNY